MLPDDAAPGLALQDYLRTLRRRKGLVILSVLLLLGAAIAYSWYQTPTYASVAKLLLKPSGQQVFASDASQQVSDVAASVQTEIEVIKTEPVQELVRGKIGSAPPVQVAAVGDTQLITIRAESTQPERAAAVANAYANSYIEFRRKQANDDLAASTQEVQSKITDLQKQIDDLSSQLDAAPVCVDTKTTAQACAQRSSIEDSVGVRRTTLINQQALFRQRLDQLQVDQALTNGGAQLVTPASPAAAPFKPAPKRNAAIGIILGLVFGVGLAFLLDHLDDSIKGKEDFDRAVPGVPVLGLIPAVAESKDLTKVISINEPTSSAAEAYRILRTGIQFLGIDRKVRTIQVTSPNAQEGKTTTLANLAVAFSSAGFRTVAVCCDLRRPRLHEMFGLSNDIGFTSVLLGQVPLSKALQTVPDRDRLLILASGALPPNPSELLSSRRTADLLGNMLAQADIILIDSPPVLPVTDALVLSRRVDATVLVTKADTTTRKAAARATEMLNQVNAPLVGSVINGVKGESGYGNYTYRRYESDVTATNGHGRNGKSNGKAAEGTSRIRSRRAS